MMKKLFKEVILHANKKLVADLIMREGEVTKEQLKRMIMKNAEQGFEKNLNRALKGLISDSVVKVRKGRLIWVSPKMGGRK